MDKYTLILLEVEEMWSSSAAAQALISRGLGSECYKRERDLFKARRIYDLYGYEYFVRFVDRCPHIHDILEEYVPCRNGGQCTMFCTFYKGGCINATE